MHRKGSKFNRACLRMHGSFHNTYKHTVVAFIQPAELCFALNWLLLWVKIPWILSMLHAREGLQEAVYRKKQLTLALGQSSLNDGKSRKFSCRVWLGGISGKVCNHWVISVSLDSVWACNSHTKGHYDQQPVFNSKLKYTLAWKGTDLYGL